MFEKVADFLLGFFDLPINSKLFLALEFWIADVLKIFLLLVVIVFIISILRSYLPPDRIRKILAGKNSLLSSVMAAVIGVFTPFCSCSAIPMFLGFLEAGVPVSATFSFLIASPMVNEVALIMLLGMFGWKVAGLYLVFGLVIAVVSGLILEKLGAEKWIIRISANDLANRDGKMFFSERLMYAKNYTKSIIKKIWLYVVVGIALGAIIHGYVPVDFLAKIGDKSNWYAVPAAVLLGVPLYSNAAGIVPLVSVLTEKGVAIGTVLAFMMAVTGLSLPEMMILKKVLRLKLLMIFIFIITLGIVLAGLVFNAIL